MASRVKTFSLCDETYAIVMAKPNKSQHIRTLILQEDDYPRDQLEQIYRINRAALNYACALLREIHRNKVDVVGELQYANEHGEDAWDAYNRDEEAGHGVDWLRDRIIRFARDEMA